MTTETDANFRHTASHRRRAAAADRGAGGEQCRRAGGAARRRQDHARAAGAARRAVGERTRKSWCWSRAGWRRAPRPRAWRRRWANRSATPSACACASARRFRKRTRIEVVTEGVFTRLVLDDPSLDGVAAVLFDEFHERSLDADLGLALARDAQQGLREDLKILVMSATLDGARVAALLGDAPVVESEGRAFPVETRYLGRDPRAPIERQVADAVARALRAEHRLAAGVPAGRRRNPPHRDAAEGARHRSRPSTSSRCTARSMRASRTAPSRRRRRAGARWCWRPRSRRPRSPSKACASSSTAAWRACRATSRMSA